MTMYEKIRSGSIYITIVHNNTKKPFSYPYESDNTTLFPLLVLVLFAFFVGSLGIPLNLNYFNQEGTGLDILSKWLVPPINLLHQKVKDSKDWYEFLKDAIFSVSIAYFWNSFSVLFI